MILLQVDEAYAFDYLSILHLKKMKSINSNDAWEKCYDYLKNQFDIQNWSLIINSQEYKNLIKANDLTFDAVDKAKNNKVTAKYVDFCNYQRYIAKQNFQKKFFDNALKEQKFGYEKYENSHTNTN